MKGYGYVSVILICIWSGLALDDSEEIADTISKTTTTLTNDTTEFIDKVAELLPEGHECLSLEYEREVNLELLMGVWYVQALMCTSWSRIPFCEKVTFEAGHEEIYLNWKSLDLIDSKDPLLRATADYSSTLSVEDSGVWMDLGHDQGHPLYLVLASWHPRYLLLAKCFPFNPHHHVDVFILSRDIEYYEKDLNMFIDQAKKQGAPSSLKAQFHLWSMCEKYIDKYL